MAFNDVISRSDASVLIPTETAAEIIKDVAESNPIMRLARRLPNMSRSQRTLPVLSALANAYFVNGDTGLKQTTDTNWTNVTVTAEEVACIVPIPEAVLDDSEYDIWGEVRPQIVEAMNIAICNAVLYGTNIPASWTTGLGAAGLVTGASNASQSVSLAAYSDVYEAILGETAAGADGVYMLVEADGFQVTGNLAHLSMKGKLRNLRDANGNPIFKTNPQDPTMYELDGAPLLFPSDGTINPASSLLVAGQWNKLVYSMRQDITYKILDQAVIQDAAGNIVFNLAQQDMVAMRAVMRLGFALPNPINRMNATATTRYPFAVLTA
jgi:HK97 family phage major capsid protein